jgi:Flp pilus assembly protein TadG
MSLAAACALKRFRKDRSGSAAIEFAMIAAPFFMMIFAIIETALIFFATQVLETATQDASRLIMTGQAQMGSMSASDFKNNVCTRLSALLSCAGIDVEVKSYPTFGSISLSNPISGGTYTSPTGYSPGGAGQIVVVRIFYQWPLFVTKLGFNIGDISGGKRLLAGVAAFRNEPGPF